MDVYSIKFLVSLKKNRNYFDLKKLFRKIFFIFYNLLYFFICVLRFQDKAFLITFISIIAAENIDYYLNKLRYIKNFVNHGKNLKINFVH